MADTNNTPATEQQEPTTQQTQPSQQSNTPRDMDAFFDKLDAILDKRSGGIARSALKEDGMDPGEAAEIVKAYRQHKAGETQKQADALAALQAENQTLKAQMLESRLNNAAMAQAGKLGVAPDTVPYLLKLADLTGAVDDKGTIDEGAISEALNKVLTDVPALKPQNTQAKGFVPIGGDGGDGQSAAEDDRMRKWFGLPPKK